MSRVTVRFAEPERDAAAILRIYAPYIAETAVTFETEIPSEPEFEERVRGIVNQFPYLVVEIDGRIVGYTYAHRQAERALMRGMRSFRFIWRRRGGTGVWACRCMHC